jgi:hypothetical protein
MAQAYPLTAGGHKPGAKPMMSVAAIVFVTGAAASFEFVSGLTRLDI